MGQQMPKRDVASGRAQLRLARTVESFQHLGCGELRQHVPDRPVERELAALDELHGGGRRDRLGHGGDPEQCVDGHGGARRQHALAERTLVDGTVPCRRHGDHAWYRSGLGRLAEHLVGL